MKLMNRVKDLLSRKTKQTPLEKPAEKTPEVQAESPRPSPVTTKPVDGESGPSKSQAANRYSDQRLCQIVRGPHVSEKTVRLAEQRQHCFEVARDASRDEVKAAVERLMNVQVDGVRISNVSGKRKRKGTRSGWRKAMVTLKAGQDLEMTEIGT